MSSSTDRLEKEILLRAPHSRVWRALTDAQEFGTWFRMALAGPFVAGQMVRGRITHPGYEHLQVEMWIERIDAERYFSLRWHPYAIDPDVDYSNEPTTLVEFYLEQRVDGTLLRVIESGFDNLPAARRNEAFRMNSNGWAAQLENISRYVSG